MLALFLRLDAEFVDIFYRIHHHLELFKRYLVVFAEIRFAHHFVDLFLRHLLRLSDFLQGLSQVFFRDEASAVHIEELKSGPEDFLIHVDVLVQARSDELAVVNFSISDVVGILNDFLYLFSLRLEAALLHGCLELFDVDESCLVFVYLAEYLRELLDLLVSHVLHYHIHCLAPQPIVSFVALQVVEYLSGNLYVFLWSGLEPKVLQGLGNGDSIGGLFLEHLFYQVSSVF